MTRHRKTNSGLLAKFQDLRQVPMKTDDGRPDTNQVDCFVYILKTTYKDDPAAIERVSRTILESKGRVNLHDYR